MAEESSTPQRMKFGTALFRIAQESGGIEDLETLPRSFFHAPDESDCGEHIRSLAVDVFGDAAKAERWLNKAKIRFEGRTPLEMTATEEGALQVQDLLLQFEHGILD